MRTACALRLRAVLPGLLALVAACAAPPPPPPEETAFARALLARLSAGPPPGPAAAPEAPPPALPEPPPAPAEAEILRGLIDPRALAGIDPAADPGPGPFAPARLEALAVARSPRVRSARAGLEAALTGYAQAADLSDLVGLYRSFLRETDARVGPEASRRPAAAIAPSPNLLALSGEVTRHTVEIALEDLRREVRDVLAAARAAHAEAAHLLTSRGILGEEVALEESLLTVLRARLSVGEAGQAGVLAFTGRLEALRTELEVLGEREAAVRARLNELLDRPAGAPLELPAEPAAPGPVPEAATVLARAVEERQEFRAALARVGRARAAERMAETMALPRLDLGGSRFEREMGPERFPPPGRVAADRGDFGVREAQLAEMRARREALEAAAGAERARTEAGAREAHHRLDAARRRLAVSADRLVPLAVRSAEAARGAFEGGRSGYLDLLDALRRLLEARLRQADHARDVQRARAELLRAVGVGMEER